MRPLMIRRRGIRTLGVGGEFSPADLPGLVSWYDFSGESPTLFQDTARTTPITANGQVIKGVTDRGSAAAHLSEATNGPTYTTGALNGRSSARYDGTNDVLSAAATPLGGSVGGVDYTVFTVGKCNAVSADDTIYALRSNVSSNPIKAQIGFITTGVIAIDYRLDDASGLTRTTTTDSDDGVSRIYSARESSLVQTIRRNGTDLATSGALASGAITVTRVGVGASVTGVAGSFLNGDINEVLLYSRALTAAEQNSVGTYLASRWGLSWTDI